MNEVPHFSAKACGANLDAVVRTQSAVRATVHDYEAACSDLGRERFRMARSPPHPMHSDHDVTGARHDASFLLCHGMTLPCMASFSSFEMPNSSRDPIDDSTMSNAGTVESVIDRWGLPRAEQRKTNLL